MVFGNLTRKLSRKAESLGIKKRKTVHVQPNLHVQEASLVMPAAVTRQKAQAPRSPPTITQAEADEIMRSHRVFAEDEISVDTLSPKSDLPCFSPCPKELPVRKPSVNTLSRPMTVFGKLERNQPPPQKNICDLSPEVESRRMAALRRMSDVHAACALLKMGDIAEDESLAWASPSVLLPVSQADQSQSLLVKAQKRRISERQMENPFVVRSRNEALDRLPPKNLPRKSPYAKQRRQSFALPQEMQDQSRIDVSKGSGGVPFTSNTIFSSERKVITSTAPRLSSPLRKEVIYSSASSSSSSSSVSNPFVNSSEYSPMHLSEHSASPVQDETRRNPPYNSHFAMSDSTLASVDSSLGSDMCKSDTASFMSVNESANSITTRIDSAIKDAEESLRIDLSPDQSPEEIAEQEKLHSLPDRVTLSNSFCSPLKFDKASGMASTYQQTINESPEQGPIDRSPKNKETHWRRARRQTGLPSQFATDIENLDQSRSSPSSSFDYPIYPVKTLANKPMRKPSSNRSPMKPLLLGKLSSNAKDSPTRDGLALARSRSRGGNRALDLNILSDSPSRPLPALAISKSTVSPQVGSEV